MSASHRIDAVVFDLGNVAVRWDRELLYRSVIEDVVLRRWFLDHVVTLEWNAQLDRGQRFDDAISELAGRFPEWRREIEVFGTRWTETLGDADDGTVALLADLVAAGTPVYALTNWSAETFPEARARFEWLEWFDGIVVSGEEGVVKPTPAIFERLIERYALTPDRTVFTDDSPANVEGARRCGLRAELWQGASAFRATLAQLGVAGAATTVPGDEGGTS